MTEVVHELRTWPEFFGAILEGSKTFELRRDDRGFAVGHMLRLLEFDPSGEYYTGRSVTRHVSYVLHGPGAEQFGLKPGYCILGLTDD